MLTGGMAGQAVLGLLALGAVVLLILGAARVARAVPALRVPGQAAGAVALRSTLALDRGRRLHLVEAAGREVLLLTGGATDCLLILPPPP